MLAHITQDRFLIGFPLREALEDLSSQIAKVASRDCLIEMWRPRIDYVQLRENRNLLALSCRLSAEYSQAFDGHGAVSRCLIGQGELKVQINTYSLA